MKNLLLTVIVIGMCSCSGEVKVVPSKPIGNLPHNYNLTEPNKSHNVIQSTQKETSSSSIWAMMWLSSIAIAGYATYRTFKKK
jgi:hypothetical protein